MWKLCFKIWLVANALVFLVLALLPDGARLGLSALGYSSVFSLPAIFCLYGLFAFLRFAQGTVWFSWLVLLIGTAAISFVSVSLFRLLLPGANAEVDFVLPLGFVCGFSAVLVFYTSVHNWFEKFYYARYEND